MDKQGYVPNVVDMACEIIDLYQENIDLKRENKHLKELDEIHREEIENSTKHRNKMTKLIMETAFNPDSVINKGHETLLKEQIKKEK